MTSPQSLHRCMVSWAGIEMEMRWEERFDSGAFGITVVVNLFLFYAGRRFQLITLGLRVTWIPMQMTRMLANAIANSLFNQIGLNCKEFNGNEWGWKRFYFMVRDFPREILLFTLFLWMELKLIIANEKIGLIKIVVINDKSRFRTIN